MKVSFHMYANNKKVYVRCKLKSIDSGVLGLNIAFEYIARWAREDTLLITAANAAILQISNMKDASMPIFTIDGI